MLYDPAWEKKTKEPEPEIKKRSLMDIIKKLNPKNLNLKNNNKEGKGKNGKIIARIFNAMFY
jgi:hypothetical protein